MGGGKNTCVHESILLLEGLDIYVFLQACLRLLKRIHKTPNSDSSRFWQPIAEQIKDVMLDSKWKTEINQAIQSIALLSDNEQMMELVIQQVETMIGTASVSSEFGENDYFVRWQWYIQYKNSNVKAGYEDYLSGKNYLQMFHWVIIQIQNARTEEEIKDLRSNVSNNFLSKNRNDEGDDWLLACINIWFGDEESDKNTKWYEEKFIEATLVTYLNLIKENLRTVEVSRIEEYKKYLFTEGESLLPVYPGIRYPGIFALKEKSVGDSQIVSNAKRVDFIDHPCIATEEGWISYKIILLCQYKCLRKICFCQKKNILV